MRELHEELAPALRALRTASGLTADTVARKAAMSASKLSKIENGHVLPSITDVEHILSALDVSPEVRAEFAKTARIAATEATAWSELRRTGHWRHQAHIHAIEERAESIRLFQGQLIPGLLQTPEYANAVFSTPPAMPEDARARSVAARMERQDSLYNRRKSFTFVIAEHVLRWRIADPTVMALQVERVSAVARLSNVTVGVLPLSRRMPNFPMTCFGIYGARLVIVETFHAQVDTLDPKDIETYEDVFQRFADAALYDDQMRDFLDEVRDEYLRERESI